MVNLVIKFYNQPGLGPQPQSCFTILYYKWHRVFFQGYTIENSGITPPEMQKNCDLITFLSLQTDKYVYFYSSLGDIFVFFLQANTVVSARSALDVCRIVHAEVSLEIYLTKQPI